MRFSGEAYKRWDSDSVGNWTMFTRAEDNDLVQRRRHGLDNRILGLQALEGPAWASVCYEERKGGQACSVEILVLAIER